METNNGPAWLQADIYKHALSYVHFVICGHQQYVLTCIWLETIRVPKQLVHMCLQAATVCICLDVVD